MISDLTLGKHEVYSIGFSLLAQLAACIFYIYWQRIFTKLISDLAVLGHNEVVLLLLLSTSQAGSDGCQYLWCQPWTCWGRLCRCLIKVNPELFEIGVMLKRSGMFDESEPWTCQQFHFPHSNWLLSRPGWPVSSVPRLTWASWNSLNLGTWQSTRSTGSRFLRRMVGELKVIGSTVVSALDFNEEGNLLNLSKARWYLVAGVYMDESLNIVRHFFNTFNKNPENDHWYPQVHHKI